MSDAAAAAERRPMAQVTPMSTRRAFAARPEHRLLLLTAGGAGNDDAIRAVARDTVDWDRFIGLAQSERAVSVVHARLRAIAVDSVPAEALEQMRRLALVSDFSMLHLEARLGDVTRELASAGVRVMLLKGAALAHSAYSSARYRPMSDLDILVDENNALVARRVLLGAGWREGVNGFPESAYERHHHLPPLADTRTRDLQLEIHTALFPERQPFTLGARELWAHARPLRGTLPDAFVPDPIHLLLHACLHFLWSHEGRFGVWRTIRDIDALTRGTTLDWDAFAAAARASRGATCCYWTFRIARAAAGVVAPESVLDQLRPPRRGYVLRAIERHFTRNLFPFDVASPSVALDQALWELAVMPQQSGHGDIRPWDEARDFVMPEREREPQRPVPRLRRVRRLLASSGYIRTLLRSED